MTGFRSEAGPPPGYTDHVIAAQDMVGRCGATTMELRYCDERPPTVWMAIADFAPGRRRSSSGFAFTVDRAATEVAAALDPLAALERLLELLIDGGICTHCRRPAGITPGTFGPMPAPEAICWVQYDPELARYRRACE